MGALQLTICVFLALHGLAALFKCPRNLSTMDIEHIRQRHEKCVMLALIALAVIGGK